MSTTIKGNQKYKTVATVLWWYLESTMKDSQSTSVNWIVSSEVKLNWLYWKSILLVINKKFSLTGERRRWENDELEILLDRFCHHRRPLTFGELEELQSQCPKLRERTLAQIKTRAWALVLKHRKRWLFSKSWNAIVNITINYNWTKMMKKCVKIRKNKMMIYMYILCNF